MRRNAAASLVNSVMCHTLNNVENLRQFHQNLHVGVFFHSFYMDCTGISRKDEKKILTAVAGLMPRVQITVHRKYKDTPRTVSFGT
jgi:hypothetical protein